MNTRLKRGKHILLLFVVLCLSVICTGQKLIVQEYDTTHTKNYLKNKLLEIYNQKDDSVDISVKFFQLRKSSWIKSFYLYQNRNDCAVRFFSVDSIFPKKYIQLIDSANLLSILSHCDENLEIFGERFTNSTYTIIIRVKVGAVSFEVKTTNLAFFNETNDCIEAIKKLLSLLNLDYRGLIHEAVDG